MKIERARNISETSRNAMTAEALALAYDARTNLDKRAAIEAIAATLNSIGDPLERIWMEDANARRRTYKLEQALTLLGERVDFRYLWAIPASERKNRRSRWLTVATIDNIAANTSILFFALPRGLTQEFVPQLRLLELLAQADTLPQYGFGYTRNYGSPDDFGVGYGYTSGVRAIDRMDWVRLAAFGEDRAGNPVEQSDRYRDARTLIPDVFPLNVLSDFHLRQRMGDVSLKEWIIRNTGTESLMQIGPRCFAWSVPASRTASLSAQLKESGSAVTSAPRRVDSQSWPGSALARSAPSGLSPTVCTVPTRCNPALIRSNNRTAPAAIVRAAFVPPSRRSGS
jgi:hypothetical protein